MLFAVVVFPGSNCDHDVYHVAKHVLGCAARYVWHKALAVAGVQRGDDEDATGMHALRHHYASVLLDAGESIKAVSDYLGHSDPGFTLRTYTHLMPSSHERTRNAVDGAFACYMGVASRVETHAQ